MSLSTNDIRQKFIEYYEKKEHEAVPSSPLVPENDHTTLFTGSGMQPMLQYLLGKPYPSGSSRIVDSQKCFRAADIEEVGDNRHTTFFEMLGNWSFGDYWKEDQLRWAFEFLVDELGIDPTRLYVTAYDGDEKNGIPRDEEAVEIWKKLFEEKGITAEVGDRIGYYAADKNWWSRAGVPENMPVGEPGGPDSEIFYQFDVEHDIEFGDECHINCDCGRDLEIANLVFMEYKKLGEGEYQPLPQKNVDFGGGLERMAAAVNDNPDMFTIDFFSETIKYLEEISGDKYEEANQAPMRVIADHLRGATFMLSEGIQPSNKQQGYVLRRLIRRAAVKMHFLMHELDSDIFVNICHDFIDMYGEVYFDIEKDKVVVDTGIREELEKFGKSLAKGLREIEKREDKEIDVAFAFDLYQTHGFPFEITQEILEGKGIKISEEEFAAAKEEHSEKSRTASAGAFKGGLGDSSEKTVWYHTITHLLHQALREVLGEDVKQAGSNITPERLRFDFTFGRALTEEERAKVEQIVNEQKDKGQQVAMESMPLQDALDSGAIAFFKEKYADMVNVYSIGDYSREICGGPHVENTGDIKGIFKIVKEKSSGAGVRRIRAIVE